MGDNDFGYPRTPAQVKKSMPPIQPVVYDEYCDCKACFSYRTARTDYLNANVPAAERPAADAQVAEAYGGLAITARITQHLPTDAKARKALPVITGVLDYFPDAIVAVAELSRKGNDQHNPGQPLHWDRTKSLDHADTLGRHLIDRGTLDSDGVRHSAKVAWRALALLQTEIENETK